MNPISKSVLGVAVIALAATALIHFIEAPAAFGEISYKGMLFVANGVGAIVALIGILRGARWGWILGLVITGGAILGYVASRTIGLPGLPAEPDAWLEPLGAASLIVEGLFVILFFATSRTRREPSPASHR